MKRKIFTLAITALLVFSAGHVMSQPPPPPPPNDTSGPIDSGSLALLVATGFYGYVQLKKKAVPATIA